MPFSRPDRPHDEPPHPALRNSKLRSQRRSRRARQLLAALLLLLSSGAQAAEDDARLWISANGTLLLGEAWSASLLLQPRFAQDIGEFERFLVQPSVARRFGDALSLGLGYDAHLIREPRARTEHRIWQQAGFRHGLAGVAVAHRLLLEQRFVPGVGGVAARLRYQGRGTLPLFGSRWYAALANEVFFNLNSRRSAIEAGFGENRVFAGLGYRIAEMARVEAGYQLQYVGRPGGTDAANHTLVLTFSLETAYP